MAHAECGERKRQPRREQSYDRRSKSYTAAAATTDAEKGSASTELNTATFRQRARKRPKAFTQAPNTLGQVGVRDSSTGGICSTNSSNQRRLVTSGTAITKWRNRQQLYPPQFPQKHVTICCSLQRGQASTPNRETKATPRGGAMAHERRETASCFGTVRSPKSDS